MEYRVNISRSLMVLRQQTGETMEQVAEGIGGNLQSIARYESGERCPKADVLARLADHYGVALDYIAGRTVTRYVLEALPPEYQCLTLDEMKLLKRFRALDDDCRELVLAKALEYQKFPAISSADTSVG